MRSRLFLALHIVSIDSCTAELRVPSEYLSTSTSSSDLENASTVKFGSFSRAGLTEYCRYFLVRRTI